MKQKNRYLKLLLGALFASMTTASQAAVVFADDFEGPGTTALAGRTPNVGGTWAGGSYQVSGGRVDTGLGGNGDAFGNFTTALSAGHTLTLQLTTTSFSFSNWGGISLYVGGTETAFIGDPGGGAGNIYWGVDFRSVGGGFTNTDDASGATTATFVYEFDSGDWTFTTTSGGNISGTAAAGFAFDRLRIAHGNDGFAIDGLSVDISPIPEPSAALLSLLGLGAFLRRRR